MSEIIKFNLPKVQLRIKTTPTSSLPVVNEAHVYRQYGSPPSGIEDRIKMKNKIQESYLKFRKNKKNNYSKRTISLGKQNSANPQEQQTSILLKKHTQSVLSHLQFALTAEQQSIQEKIVLKDTRKKQNRSSRIVYKNRISQIGRGKKSPYKHEENAQLYRNNSMHQASFGQQELGKTIQLSGKRCNYLKFTRPKQAFYQFCSLRPKMAPQKQPKKGSTFQLDPWIDESISKCKNGFYDTQYGL